MDLNQPAAFHRQSAPRRICLTISEEAYQFLLDEVRRSVRNGKPATRSSVCEDGLRLLALARGAQ